MGCKKCLEKAFRVDFGERGFRSGIPPPMRPAFILLFISIFLICAGILLCILHQTYVIARTDQLYSEDNYFLIAGVVAICLGLVIMCIGGGWCYHAYTVQAEQIEDYKIRKGYSMENVNRYAPSVVGSDRDRDRDDSRNFSNSSYPPEYGDAHGHPHHPRHSHGSSSHPGYQDPRAAGHPRHPSHVSHHGGHHPDSRHPSQHGGYPDQQQSSPGQKEDMSMRANRGFDDFKSFVKRNVEATKADSPRRRPYTDRLTGQGYTDEDIARSRGYGRPTSGVSGASEEEFNLAKTYIQDPSKYYAQDTTNEVEDQSGGYEVMPVDDPNRRHRGRGGPYHGDAGVAPKSTGYRYNNGRPLDTSQDSNNVQVHQAATAKAGATYRYEKGRPLDSSQDSEQSNGSDQQVSMAAGGGSQAPAAAIPTAVKDKATLRYNPKDGQWYYYYKGKPISKYDPDMKAAGSQGGPVYKYINGKPVLLPVPNAPLNAPV